MLLLQFDVLSSVYMYVTKPQHDEKCEMIIDMYVYVTNSQHDEKREMSLGSWARNESRPPPHPLLLVEVDRLRISAE